ncbi:3-keto-5-aminohexanoate cleavage protein [Pseudonocardia benzenivorans]
MGSGALDHHRRVTSPVIVELALNGPTPRSADRHVPRSPAEITAVALEGIELGASIVHNHNDDPMFTADGVHAVEPYVRAWTPILDRYPDVLLYPTMGAAARASPSSGAGRTSRSWPGGGWG